MSFRKMILYLVVFLCVLSIYYDLSGRNPHHTVEPVDRSEHTETISAVPMVVKPGQSVLSITEQINTHVDYLDISQMIHDFKRLNPGVDPLNIQTNQIYYFPLY